MERYKYSLKLYKYYSVTSTKFVWRRKRNTLSHLSAKNTSETTMALRIAIGKTGFNENGVSGKGIPFSVLGISVSPYNYLPFTGTLSFSTSNLRSVRSNLLVA